MLKVNFLKSTFRQCLKIMKRKWKAMENTLILLCGILLDKKDIKKIRTLSYKNADIFLVCFALNSPESFDNIKARWSKELKQHRASAPIILVGLKADLKEASFDSTAAEKMAEEIGGSGYMECSAKTFHGVSELFELALKTGLTAKLAGGKDNVKKGFFSRLMKK